MMRFWNLALVLLLVVGALAACGGGAAPAADEAPAGDEAPVAGDASSAAAQEDLAQALEDEAASGGYTSEVLVVSYEGAMPASSQLALGIFRLKDTDNAVTAEQARVLLPLWQAIQSGALQSDTETNAVLKQIEGAMTAEQLAAIAAMQLTVQDMVAWMQEQGVNLGPPPGAGQGQGGFSNLNEEERASMRATRQAGGEGGFPGGGPGAFANMSEEERESMRATAEASGMTFGNRAGARQGQIVLIAEPLVELLAELAAE
jgi:hypothetical protein